MTDVELAGKADLPKGEQLEGAATVTRRSYCRGSPFPAERRLPVPLRHRVIIAG